MWETSLEKYLKILKSEHRSTVNILKGPKHSWNLHGTPFIIISHPSVGNTVGKCLLVTSEILALFFNILIGHHKCSLCSRESLQQSIQMHLYKKQTIFSEFFALFLKCTTNYVVHFRKETVVLTACLFPKLWTAKDVIR